MPELQDDIKDSQMLQHRRKHLPIPMFYIWAASCQQTELREDDKYSVN